MSWQPSQEIQRYTYITRIMTKHQKTEHVNMFEMAPSLFKSIGIQSLQFPFPSNDSTFSSPTPLESRKNFSQFTLA